MLLHAVCKTNTKQQVVNYKPVVIWLSGFFYMFGPVMPNVHIIIKLFMCSYRVPSTFFGTSDSLAHSVC